MNPYEPSGNARQNAADLFDQFKALMGAGFTEAQAMQILCTERAAIANAGVTYFLQNPQEGK